MSSTDYSLLSTTKCDPQFLQLSWNTRVNSGTPSPYLLLAYHHDRLLEAAKLHSWPPPVNLTLSLLEEHCNSAIKNAEGERNEETPESVYRIRILLSHTGTLSVTVSTTASLPITDPMAAALWLPSPSVPNPPTLGSELLIVHPDCIPTPSSVFTRTKTTRRDHYDAARNRFKIPLPPTSSPLEVVLYNEEGDITETTIRNIAFVRRSPPRWVTPSACTGCLPGVCRRWLLEQGRIVEADQGELRRSDVIDGEYVLTFNGVEGCRLGQMQFHPV